MESKLSLLVFRNLNFGAKLSEGEDLVKEWQKENEYATNALKNQFRSLPPMIILAILILYVFYGAYDRPSPTQFLLAQNPLP